MRVRLFRPSERGELLYVRTFMTSDDSTTYVHLVQEQGLQKGDVILAGDYYLRLDTVQPVTYTSLALPVESARSLYSQAVRAERAAAGVV